MAETRRTREHKETPMPVLKTRTVRIIVTAAAAVLSSAVVADARRTSAGSSRLAAARTITWDYVQDPPVIGTPLCDQTSCLIPFSITGRASGDAVGTAIQAGSAVQLPGGALYATSTVVFTGTIEPCGTGTVAMRSTGFNRAGGTSGEVVIVDGSGTGQLTGIGGSGSVVDGRVEPDGQGTRTIVMRVRCTRRS
jgi:Protein of unknown function (DUF3224)